MQVNKAGGSHEYVFKFFLYWKEIYVFNKIVFSPSLSLFKNTILFTIRIVINFNLILTAPDKYCVNREKGFQQLIRMKLSFVLM